MYRQENPRIYIEKINRQTAMDLKYWGKFEDPRLSGYNYGDLSDFEINFWYNSVSTPRKRYFAVKKSEDDRFIGFFRSEKLQSPNKKIKIRNSF